MTPALEAAYAEPHRRYHTRRHIEACLATLAGVAGLTPAERLTLERAIWWHDAVYDPRRSNNEEKSAEMAGRDLAALGAPSDEIAEVARLIRLTKRHHVEAGDRLGALMVSIDLAILGADEAAYDAYAAGVREEYAHVPDDAFAAGRRVVLEAFLAAPVLFPDAEIRARLQGRARANLARELAALARFEG